jgi:hypothetical protein
MVIPKRGARVRILIGEPIEVPAKLDAVQLEAVRASLEERLLAMHAELDARTGFSDTHPLKAPIAPKPIASDRLVEVGP